MSVATSVVIKFMLFMFNNQMRNVFGGVEFFFENFMRKMKKLLLHEIRYIVVEFGISLLNYDLKIRTFRGRNVFLNLEEKHIFRNLNLEESYNEVDFPISDKSKIIAFETKSSGIGKHESIDEFGNKYSSNIERTYLLSQKDIKSEGTLFKKPFYLTPFLV